MFDIWLYVIKTNFYKQKINLVLYFPMLFIFTLCNRLIFTSDWIYLISKWKQLFVYTALHSCDDWPPHVHTCTDHALNEPGSPKLTNQCFPSHAQSQWPIGMQSDDVTPGRVLHIRVTFIPDSHLAYNCNACCYQDESVINLRQSLSIP